MEDDPKNSAATETNIERDMGTQTQNNTNVGVPDEIGGNIYWDYNKEPIPRLYENTIVDLLGGATNNRIDFGERECVGHFIIVSTLQNISSIKPVEYCCVRSEIPSFIDNIVMNDDLSYKIDEFDIGNISVDTDIDTE